MIIYNVMYTVDSVVCVGIFYQGSFSTEKLAEDFIQSAPSYMRKGMEVYEHTLDTVTTKEW